jgi:hypothetical protein
VMTAIGWILVLGAAGAYALLVFACWRAVKKGPYDWTDADHALTAIAVLRAGRFNGGQPRGLRRPPWM